MRSLDLWPSSELGPTAKHPSFVALSRDSAGSQGYPVSVQCSTDRQIPLWWYRDMIAANKGIFRSPLSSHSSKVPFSLWRLRLTLPDRRCQSPENHGAQNSRYQPNRIAIESADHGPFHWSSLSNEKAICGAVLNTWDSGWLKAQWILSVIKRDNPRGFIPTKLT
jgi:hypothetical protein